MARPFHKPTDELRKQVEAMSAYGVPQKEIGRVIGIDDKTLKKHYSEELERATDRANMKIASMLYKKAVGGDTTCMIFWLKTRAKWSERSQVELTGEDGGPLEISINFVNAKDKS